jgi:hypothetical protein
VAQRGVWEIPQETFWSAGTLTTAGNLVFQGRADGRFIAYDARTGDELWSFDTGLGISAPPITYGINGTLYIALLVGFGGASSKRWLCRTLTTVWIRGHILECEHPADTNHVPSILRHQHDAPFPTRVRQQNVKCKGPRDLGQLEPLTYTQRRQGQPQGIPSRGRRGKHPPAAHERIEHRLLEFPSIPIRASPGPQFRRHHAAQIQLRRGPRREPRQRLPRLLLPTGVDVAVGIQNVPAHSGP